MSVKAHAVKATSQRMSRKLVRTQSKDKETRNHFGRQRLKILGKGILSARRGSADGTGRGPGGGVATTDARAGVADISLAHARRKIHNQAQVTPQRRSWITKPVYPSASSSSSPGRRSLGTHISNPVKDTSQKARILRQLDMSERKRGLAHGAGRILNPGSICLEEPVRENQKYAGPGWVDQTDPDQCPVPLFLSGATESTQGKVPLTTMYNRLTRTRIQGSQEQMKVQGCHDSAESDSHRINTEEEHLAISTNDQEYCSDSWFLPATPEAHALSQEGWLDISHPWFTSMEIPESSPHADGKEHEANWFDDDVVGFDDEQRSSSLAPPSSTSPQAWLSKLSADRRRAGAMSGSQGSEKEIAENELFGVEGPSDDESEKCLFDERGLPSLIRFPKDFIKEREMEQSVYGSLFLYDDPWSMIDFIMDQGQDSLSHSAAVPDGVDRKEGCKWSYVEEFRQSPGFVNGSPQGIGNEVYMESHASEEEEDGREEEEIQDTWLTRFLAKTDKADDGAGFVRYGYEKDIGGVSNTQQDPDACEGSQREGSQCSLQECDAEIESARQSEGPDRNLKTLHELREVDGKYLGPSLFDNDSDWN